MQILKRSIRRLTAQAGVRRPYVVIVVVVGLTVHIEIAVQVAGQPACTAQTSGLSALLISPSAFPSPDTIPQASGSM